MLDRLELEASQGALRQRDILEVLSTSAREMLLRRCKLRVYRKGEDLYTEGSRHKATFLVKSGLIRAFHTSKTGKELTVNYWGSGDLIGGPHFFDDTKNHMWSARAVENAEVYAISGRDLKTLTLRFPEIGEAVLEAMCFKGFWMSLLMQALGTGSVRARLADLIVKLAMLYGEVTSEGLVIARRFTQDDLGNMVGATRQWINAKLMEFESRGIITIYESRIVVHDLEELKAVASDRPARRIP